MDGRLSHTWLSHREGEWECCFFYESNTWTQEWCAIVGKVMRLSEDLYSSMISFSFPNCILLEIIILRPLPKPLNGFTQSHECNSMYAFFQAELYMNGEKAPQKIKKPLKRPDDYDK